MKINFFNQPYLFYPSDSIRIPSIDRPHLHIVRRISLKEKKKAIVIVGWAYNGS